jgi:hypothetical protein
MRARRIGATIGVLGALLATPIASAAPATESVITIEVIFDGPETFTATGGVVCESGTATTEGFANFGGRKNRGVFTFHIVKTLTCDDDSGTFKLLVNAATSPNSPSGASPRVKEPATTRDSTAAVTWSARPCRMDRASPTSTRGR